MIVNYQMQGVFAELENFIPHLDIQEAATEL